MLPVGTKVRAKQHPYVTGIVIRHHDEYNVVERRVTIFRKTELTVHGFLDDELEVIEPGEQL